MDAQKKDESELAEAVPATVETTKPAEESFLATVITESEADPVPETAKPNINVIKEITETNIKEILNSVTNDDEDDDDDESETEIVNEYENENNLEENETNGSESNEYSLSNLIQNNSLRKNDEELKDCTNNNQEDNDDVFDSLFGHRTSKRSNEGGDRDESIAENSHIVDNNEQFDFD